MLGRATLRRCPWCGDRRAYFTGWFSRQDGCRRCGTPWRRDDVGFALGAATMNVLLTCGLIVVGATIGMIVTAPDFAVGPIVIGLVIGAVVVPVVLYPVTYTLWQAIDLAMRPPDADELAAWSVRALLVDVELPNIDGLGELDPGQGSEGVEVGTEGLDVDVSMSDAPRPDPDGKPSDEDESGRP